VRTLVERHLLDVVVPFWTRLVDRERGGFYGRVDYDLIVHKNADRGLVQQARHLYAFSRLENHYRDGRFLPYAEAGYRFLVERMRDPIQGGYVWMSAADGAVRDPRKVTYGQGFALYAFAEYYKATRSPEALARATDLFRLIERRATTPSGGYVEEFDERWHPLVPHLLTDDVEGARYSTNTLLHLLEAYANLAAAAPHPDVVASVRTLIRLFLERILQPDGTLSMYFDERFSPIASPRSFGHEIEAAWLITEAAQTIDANDPTIAAATLGIAGRVLAEAILPDGRVAYGPVHDGIDPTAVWWVQAEAMVGFLDLDEKAHVPAAHAAAEATLSFCLANLHDRRPGAEWFWSVDREGRPNRDRGIAEPWKTPYHLVRALVEIMERLDKVK